MFLGTQPFKKLPSILRVKIINNFINGNEYYFQSSEMERCMFLQKEKRRKDLKKNGGPARVAT